MTTGLHASQSLTLRGHTAVGPGSLRVLLAVMRFREDHGYPPTVRDVCGMLGRNVNAVQVQIARLRKAGLLRGCEERGTRRALVPAVRLEVAGC